MSLKKNEVLLTGGSGFLGKTIYQILSQSGYVVKRLGRSNGNEIICDLSTAVPSIDHPVDILVHNAGKAHTVPKTENEKKAFFEVNVTGTKNLLQGLENSPATPGAIVFISTIAVYGLTQGELITEDHPLLATDAYGKSKIDAERVLQQWCDQKLIPLTILRLPLLAGENPPGNLGSMIRGLEKGFYFSIARGRARKSIVMANDVAAIIPVVAFYPGTYNLTDGFNPAFSELERIIAEQLKTKKPRNIPLWLARILGVCGDIVDKILPGKSPITSSKVEKIKSTLTFNDQKARRVFGWNPVRVIDTFKIE